MNNLKVIFMGTPEFSLPVLEGLNSKYNVVMVVCQPDKPSNRGVVQYSPVKDFAIKNNIKVFQPVNVKNEYHEILSFPHYPQDLILLLLIIFILYI